MRITALIVATAAALALSASASAASSALHEPAGVGHEYASTATNHDLGLDNDQHDIGANSASMQLIDTAALGAAGHRGHALPT